MAKRKRSGHVDFLSDILEPLGVQNMLSSSSESDEDNSDIDFGYDWIHHALEEGRASMKAQKPTRKRKRGWRNRAKMPYTCSAFYRDYHNENVRVKGHTDAKEFRLDYRMPWTKVNELVELFVNNKWVVTSDHCKAVTDRSALSRSDLCSRACRFSSCTLSPFA